MQCLFYLREAFGRRGFHATSIVPHQDRAYTCNHGKFIYFYGRETGEQQLYFRSTLLYFIFVIGKKTAIAEILVQCRPMNSPCAHFKVVFSRFRRVLQTRKPTYWHSLLSSILYTKINMLILKPNSLYIINCQLHINFTH